MRGSNSSLDSEESFACNCLQLRGSKGSVLAISDAGWRSLDDSQPRGSGARHPRGIVGDSPPVTAGWFTSKKYNSMCKP